jgi:hypothetical protein
MMAHALDALVGIFLQKHGHTWQIYLIQNWRTIVGNLHTRICLEKIQGDTLVIGVYDVHWMQELFLLNSMLLEMINAHFDAPYIKQVRLRLAKKGPEQAKQVKKTIACAEQLPPALLTQQHREALAQVKDQELQTVLQDFLRHCKT